TPTVSGVFSSVASNSAGYYSFVVLPNGSYTLTPVLAGTTFFPPIQAIIINNAAQTNVNFIGQTGYSIRGRVVNCTGGGLSSGLTQADSGQNATSNTAGYYTILNVPNGARTLTPSKASLTFTPLTKSPTMAGADVFGQNFVGG